MTRTVPRGEAERAAPPVLDRYRLVRRLGAGGFGVVWLAEDERLRRQVAVKRVPRDRLDDGRLHHEARAAARLHHPGVVSLYEAGADEEYAYLVSELVRGPTLAQLERSGALSDRDVAAIGLALCGALAHAHAHGVVHRDVKPGNVLVPEAPTSGAGVAKLTDFGVARLADGEAVTRTGDVVGTLLYMAPEQAAGRRVDERADLWSLALVLYEAFAEENPLRRAPAMRYERALPSLRRRRRDLPLALVRAIDRALQRDPDRRGAVEDLREALAVALPRLDDEVGHVGVVTEPLPVEAEWWGEQEVEVAPASVGEDTAPWRPRRHRVPERLVAAAGAGIAALGASAALGPYPAPALAIAGATAALVGLLPRVGWLAGAAVLVGWLAGPANMPGAALLVAGALAPVPFVLPHRPAFWSLPVLAPLLGAVGLAGAFPAVAGRLRGPVSRAATAALGVVWILAAEALAGERLLAGPAPGTHPPDAWAQTPALAWHEAVLPIARSGLLGLAVVWAVAALVLPYVTRTRRLAAALAATAAWAAALALATTATVGAAAVSGAAPRGAAVSAVVAILIALGRRPGATTPALA